MNTRAARRSNLNPQRNAAIVRFMQSAADVASDRKLSLAEVLNDLVEDGMVGRAEADKLIADRRMQRADHHPLAVIADQKWKSLRPPNKLLHLELLTEWLAAKTGLEYYHIDPLKINFAAVTDVMSNAYAQRFRILPVEVNTKEAVIATCEPYIKEWETELKPILRLEIRRVLANPLDIARYQIEFYNLAKSVKGAAEKGSQASGIGNFEQLVEMGKSNRQFDANDQHIVHVVDWLWQYAFEQRASDIHMEPRRDVGYVRFRIGGGLHTVHQFRGEVRAAMGSRI